MRRLIGDALEARVAAVLDAHLQHDVDHPIALALSGGGDSMALLALASEWARRHGRALLAITVDHGLSPDSPAWSDLCRTAARSAGARWVERRWTGDKPTTGLPAAARAARHALIADVARSEGARVLLFAHTADDVDEGEWMKAEGSTLGALRPWSSSPAWPEGRGLMILRPLLAERRADLRDWSRARGQSWIEDPANVDPRFGRSRARQALSRDPMNARGQPDTQFAADLALDPSAVDRTETFFGLVRVSRDVSAKGLSAAVVSAAGGAKPPRGHRATALRDRLRKGEDFAATLAGARVVATGQGVMIGREPGESKRRALEPLPLKPGTPGVWDGRFEITTMESGWIVVATIGRASRLSQADRAVLSQVPAWARGGMPVLIREGDPVPVLAWRRAKVLTLAHRRLALALGETTHERDLGRTIHGETPPTDLFSRQELTHDADFSASRDRERR